MELAFLILTVMTLASAWAAMRLRNLVHCALCLAVTFAGLAGFYLLLSAQFIGLAQVLVYVGAVSILVVFAILLTRGSDPAAAPADLFSKTWFTGLAVTALAAGTLIIAVLTTKAFSAERGMIPDVMIEKTINVKRIGQLLMTRYVLPLEVIALLLTAALIGAVIIAMKEKEPKS